MINTTTRIICLAIGSFAMLPACSDAGDSDSSPTGMLAVNLKQVPADASCLEIAVNGSRPVTRRIDLTLGAEATFEIDLLPIGQVSVSARAFPLACNAVAANSVETYAVEKPVIAQILPNQVADVELYLLHNGRADIVADFEIPAACRPESNLTAVSFNIRYDGGPGGNNAWYRSVNPRRDRVVSVMRDSSADVIGVQEALANQVDDLVAGLPEYAFFGVGRNDGVRAGEFAGIFYRKDRFELIEGDNFWLSETPETPGTVFPGSGSIRIATWVRVLDLRANRTFLFLNTHWDNVSQSSRLRSGQLIRERLAQLAQGGAVVVTGDFNTNENNAAVLAITSGPPETAPLLRDAYRLVHPVQQQNELTFHNFNGATTGQRIDYVLHNDDLKAHEASIIRTSFEGLYPSDHYPVSATMSWASDGAGTSCD